MFTKKNPELSGQFVFIGIMESLIKEGHRSSIDESYRELLDDWSEDGDIEPWKHKTLKEAINSCEHLTLAYFNGKQWKFTHNA